MKVCVYTGKFEIYSGGSIALHKLCKLLRDQGVDARTMPYDGHNFYNLPMADLPWLTPDVVAVYPEVISKNPLGRDRVARWLLNCPGKLYPVAAYDITEVAFSYAPCFGEGHPLCVIENFPQFIHSEGRAGGDTCMTLRKGRHKFGTNPQLDEIARHAVPIDDSSPTQVGRVFRNSDLFISYDAATFLNVQAVICGCESVVVPDEGISLDEWRSSHTLREFGIAYGLEDRERARDTQSQLIRRLKDVEELSVEQVKNFIRIFS